MTQHDPVVLTIAIKCFNEEEKIANALQSAIAAADESGVKSEVVVADALSTDRTVEIARRYPVSVVLLKNENDRGCGAGVQLSYQFSQGEFVYFMDGDMELVPGFIAPALEALRSDPVLAGVGGLLRDTRESNAFDRLRNKNRPSARPGEVSSLGGGGLYKRAAIDTAGGYAADANLKGYEEADLGMRLRAQGWRLQRLPIAAVRHTGHALGTASLLIRHWRSGRAMSGGVMLRKAIANTWRWDALRLLAHPIVTIVWWLLIVAATFAPTPATRTALVGALVALGAAALAGLMLRKRSLTHVVTSVIHWHYGAAAMLLGLFQRQRDPTQPVDAAELIRSAKG
jgi:glycosyltransferase involved in cell wall biosynthesis